MPESQPPRRGPGEPVYSVEPLATHTQTVIFLHGLGSNGEKFGKELLETGIISSGLTLPQLLPGARFVFPTSKRRRSSAFGRSMLTQWFDIVNLQDPEEKKEKQLKGLEESAVEIMALIRQELEKVTPNNLILGGLSQGCAMSLAVLLCLDHPIGGFIGMSGYLTYQADLRSALAEEEGEVDEDDPFAAPEEPGEKLHPSVQAQLFERDLLGLEQLEDAKTENTAHGTPVFLGHGVKDEKKPVALGRAAAQVMGDAGYEVQWETYEDLGHWYQIPEEIDDVVKFISSKIGWSIFRQIKGDLN